VDIDVPRSEYALDTATDSGDTSIDGIVRYDLSTHTVKAHSDSGDLTIRGR
jgi:hypothetical protein